MKTFVQVLPSGNGRKRLSRQLKVYLDTSVISALFDEKNPERKSLTEAFIERVANFEAYVSEITLAEIERTPDPDLREGMREIARRFSLLLLSDEAVQLANEYVRYGAVPESYPEDAYHIAIATVNGIDCLLSWNYRHLVRRKTRNIVNMVNSLYGLKPLEIMTPAELL
jgi:predicted nucleic acid-binding protein